MKSLLMLILTSLSVVFAASASKWRKDPSVVTRIIAGKNATKEDYPPIVSISLYLTQEDLKKNNMSAPPEGGHWHFCGGTIIHGQWVLTAAHCVANRTGELRKIRVRVGFIDLSVGKRLEAGEANLELEKIVQHPAYESRYIYSDDVALVKVNGSFEARRIALFESVDENLEGIKATALGWGLSEPNNFKSRSPFLLKVQDRTCSTSDWPKQVFKNATIPTDVLKKELICHGMKTGKGICQGDSGGPLILESKSKNKILVGIASFLSVGGPCGTGGFFQKARRHIGWIEKTMGAKVKRSSGGRTGLRPALLWTLVFLASRFF